MVQSEECEEDEELEENMWEEKQHRELFFTNLLSTLEGFKTDGSRSTFAVGGAVSYSDGATVSWLYAGRRSRCVASSLI